MSVRRQVLLSNNPGTYRTYVGQFCFAPNANRHDKGKLLRVYRHFEYAAFWNSRYAPRVVAPPSLNA